MCGIVGFAGSHPLPDPQIIAVMRDGLTHRGPDDAGLWSSPDGLVHLGHRRLSIIDLTEAAHQPMAADETSRIVIVFNGEIYNFKEIRDELMAEGHVFRSRSDTEVILRAYEAWGTSCPERFNGMFAFCLYDRQQRRLFLARDRAGEKPLYYLHRPGSFLFASELKAIMADPSFARQLDPEGLRSYLAYGYVPGERCILRYAKKLPPGHAMTYDLTRDCLTVWRYWTLPDEVEKAGKGLSDADLTDELESLLRDAIRKQLVADVPVGILLSGGLDSSLVTALASQEASSPVRTFTVTFPGYDGHDEGPYARLVADHFHTRHLELEAEKASPDLLVELARQFDEPLADHAIVPTYLLARLIRRHAKVALGGDGGDELFGGYPHYGRLLKQEHLRPFIPAGIRRGLAGLAARWLPPGTAGRNHLIGYGAGLCRSIAHINVYFDASLRRQLLTPQVQDAAEGWQPEQDREGLCGTDHSPLRQAMEADFRSTLADGYLVKVDRSAMLASLEVRTPFLDYRLVEFAFRRVPNALKVRGGSRKILLRHLAARLLPKELDITRKQGFTMPLNAWLKGDWGEFMGHVLGDASPDLFQPAAVACLLRRQEQGYANANRLFALSMFELWRREYKVALPQ